MDHLYHSKQLISKETIIFATRHFSLWIKLELLTSVITLKAKKMTKGYSVSRHLRKHHKWLQNDEQETVQTNIDF